MKRLIVMVSLSWVVLLFGSCAPASAPVAPLAPMSEPVAPLAPMPALSVEEAAWAKVVEAAKKEGRVTLYSFSFTGEMGRAVREGFEPAYGIKVDIATGFGLALMERLKIERRAAKFIADTYDTAAPFVALAKGDGLTVAPGDLPALDEKVWKANPRMDKEGHIFAIGIAVNTVYVNTTLVRPGEEPRSYQDLLDPRWKGKIVFPSSFTQPQGVQTYLVFKKNRVLDDAYWSQLGKQNLKVAPDIREHQRILLQGEAAVSFSLSDVDMNPFIRDGAPVKPIILSEGVVVFLAPAIAMVKNSPHPNATRLFLNWFLSREGQGAYHAARGTTSSRGDVPSFVPAAGRIPLEKFWTVDLDMHLEVARIQREGQFARLLGEEILK